jgi:hypothetical protein
MTRLEQFNFLLENMSKLSHENQNLSKEGLNKSQRLCLSLNFHGVNIPSFSTHEEIRKFFTGEDGVCEICKKDCKLNSNNIKNGFKKFCSEECHMRGRSIRQSQNNTINRMPAEKRKKWANNISVRMKKAIREGKFSPCITNSWCHSRRKVVLADKIVNVRSSWEEKFLLANPTFDYEKTRIPYVDVKGVSRTYIVDFTDKNGNIYEIKPSSKLGECNEKILAAKKYAEENDVAFIIVTEENFNFNEN